MRFEEQPLTFPNLRIFNVNVSSSSLSQYFFHCQISNLLELSLDGVPTNYSIDDLLHFINPHSASLQKLNLARLVYDKDQIKARKTKLSRFPNLLSIEFDHCSFYVLKMFSKSRYPNLHHLSAGIEVHIAMEIQTESSGCGDETPQICPLIVYNRISYHTM